MAGMSPVVAGGKRPMDAEINLVPFIDLLSCCICFLLITAVWTHVAKIDTKPTPNLPSDATPPPDQQNHIELRIGSDGYYLMQGATRLTLNKVGDLYPGQQLREQLKVLHETDPDHAAVTVSADDAVSYKELVSAMDACLKVGLTDINVKGA
jgi:biopolymer transport protein TolR